MYKLIAILICFSFVPVLKSSTIFMPDSDTAALVQLVSLTVSQLNELEELVSNAEKHTEKMQKYNEIAQDHYYRALLLDDTVSSLVSLADSDVKDLGDINSIIRSMMSQSKSIKEYLAEYGIQEKNLTKKKRKLIENDKKLKANEERAKSQVSRSFRQSNVHVNQIIAQNTGMTYQETTKANRTQNQILEALNEQNRLKTEERREAKEKAFLKEEFYSPSKISNSERFKATMSGRKF